MLELDILIIDGMGGDYSVHFITPDFMDEFRWKPGETSNEHYERIVEILGEAYENDDPRIIENVYTQEECDPEVIDLKQPVVIRRIFSHRDR